MNDKLIYKDFDRERIDRGNLTLSTAAEALRCGLVTDADYSRFESEIFDELARLITKYTRGESDSVEGGTATELLGSILYNTDLALSRLSPEAAAVVIFSVRLQNIYLEGLKINREYVLKALSMLRRAAELFLRRLQYADREPLRARHSQPYTYPRGADVRGGFCERLPAGDDR